MPPTPSGGLHFRRAMRDLASGTATARFAPAFRGSGARACKSTVPADHTAGVHWPSSELEQRAQARARRPHGVWSVVKPVRLWPTITLVTVPVVVPSTRLSRNLPTVVWMRAGWVSRMAWTAASGIVTELPTRDRQVKVA